MTEPSPWTWNKEHVKEWASDEFGIPIAQAFEENDVDGRLLLTEMNEEILRESLFIESWGMRKRILLAINGLLQKFPMAGAVDEESSASKGNSIDGAVSQKPRIHIVQTTRPKLLSVDEIYEYLDKYMKTELIPKWENEKKPVLEQSAARFWMRNQVRRRKFLAEAEASCTYILRFRLPRICEALVHAGLTRTSDLRRISLSLEAAVYDARKLLWQIELVNGDRPEAKDVVIHKSGPVKHVVENVESSDETIKSEDGFSSDDNSDHNSSDEGNAMATSESDDIDDFIEYDDEPTKSIFDYGILDNLGPKSVKDGDTEETEKSDVAEAEETDSTKDTEDSEDHAHSKLNVLKHTHKRKQRARNNGSNVPSQKRRKMSNSNSDEWEDGFTNSDTLPFGSGTDDDDFSDMYGPNYYSTIGNGHHSGRAMSTSFSPTAEQTTLGANNFPRLIKAALQMSAEQIIDAYNELKTEDPQNIHSDDKGIIEEIELGQTLFSNKNAGNEEYLNLDKQGQLLAMIQHIISLEASIPNTRLRRRLRRLRTVYSSTSESDVQLESDNDVALSDDGALSDLSNEENLEEETPESMESSQKEKGAKRKKPVFRRIRDDTAQVSAVQSSWKQKLQEAEDRAEAQLQTLDETVENVIVNIGDTDTAKHVILLPHLAHVMKPHQIEGIRFMWRQTMMLKTGGVLGHAMGLGKTLQVIAFVHTIFQEIAADNKDLPDLVKPGRILILAPITTLKNWQNEFNKWIPRSNRRLIRDVINLAETKFMQPKQRYGLIEEWHNKGGVLLMGYDNFRSCVRQAQNQDMYKWLQRPGPSLAIIDEGHKIKNAKSQLSNVVKNFETPFRICMTGYPLQNNLEEYYCMIDFIYPGFLGTIGEFRNAYKNPIEHFYEDTTPAERIISKRQLYKLRRLLGDLIHRRDAEILHKELQPKTEFDVCCKLTNEQRQVYEICVDDLKAADKLQPLQALQVFRNICNHPAAFLQQTQIAQQAASQKKGDNSGGYTSTSSFRQAAYGNTQDATSPNSTVHDKVVADTKEGAGTASLSFQPLSPSIGARNGSPIDNPGSPQDGSELNENVVNTTVETSTKLEQQLIPDQNGMADADAANPTALEQSDTQSANYVPGSPIMPYQPSFDRYRSLASEQSSMPLNSQAAADDSSIPLILNLITIIDDEEIALPEDCKTLFRNASAYVQSISDIHSIEQSCKSKVALQLVKQCIEAGDKTLLFSHTIPTLDYLEKVFKAANIHALRIDGSTPTPTRQIYVDKFNRQHKWQVFLVSSKAASLGINLVAANRVILFDLDWNPCHDEQAVARAYRFGQKKEVFVYRLQAFGTIEEHIFRLNVHKHGISSRVVDDKTLTPQKQDLKQKYFLKPTPSPAMHLQEAAYSSLTDPVLRATAEICKEDIAKIELHSNYTSEYEQAGLNEQDKQEIEQQLSFEQRIRNGEVMPSPVPTMVNNVPYRRPHVMYTPPTAAALTTSTPSSAAPVTTYTPPTAAAVTTSTPSSAASVTTYTPPTAASVTTLSYSSLNTPGSSKAAPIEIDDGSPDRPSSPQKKGINVSTYFNHSTPRAREPSPRQIVYTASSQSQKETDAIYLPALGASDMLDYPDDHGASQSQPTPNLPRDHNAFYHSNMNMRGRGTTMQNRGQQMNTSHYQQPYSRNAWPVQPRPQRPHPNHWQTGVGPGPFNPSSMIAAQPAQLPTQQISSIRDNHQMALKTLSLANPPKSYLNNAGQHEQINPPDRENPIQPK